MSAPAIAPATITRESFTRPPFDWPSCKRLPKQVPRSPRRGVRELKRLPVEKQRQRYTIPAILAAGAARRLVSQPDEPRVLRRHLVLTQHVLPDNSGAPPGQPEPLGERGGARVAFDDDRIRRQ